jgi:hypothetical protein
MHGNKQTNTKDEEKYGTKKGDCTIKKKLLSKQEEERIKTYLQNHPFIPSKQKKTTTKKRKSPFKTFFCHSPRKHPLVKAKPHLLSITSPSIR